MSSRLLKKQVLERLALNNLAEVQASFEELPVKAVINALFPALCREDSHVKWFGISCMGWAVNRLADSDMEEARVVMRRLLWSLNDESGGIGWGAPEAMAEIMARHEGLAREYSHMLVSYMREDGDEPWQDGNFLEHVALQRGLLWGIGRLSLARRDIMLQKILPEDLEFYLDSRDTMVRGLAVWVAGNLGFTSLIGRVEKMKEDQETFLLYLDGELHHTTVGGMAKEMLEMITTHE